MTSQGAVPLSVYSRYIKTGGILSFTICIVVFTLNNFLMQASNFWSGKWAQTSYPGLSTDGQYGGIFLIITLLIFATLIARAVCLAIFASRSSYRFFKMMLYNVLRRPMSFFDTTPNGQILNRLNNDVERAEASVPQILQTMIDRMSALLISITLIIIVLPIMLAVIILISISLYFFLRKFLRTTVELRRLNQLSISPMLSRISELYQGTVSLRTFGKTEWILSRFYRYQEISNSCNLHERSAGPWMGLRVDLSVTVVSTISMFMITTSKHLQWRIIASEDVVVYGTVLSNIFMISILMNYFAM